MYMDIFGFMLQFDQCLRSILSAIVVWRRWLSYMVQKQRCLVCTYPFLSVSESDFDDGAFFYNLRFSSAFLLVQKCFYLNSNYKFQFP